MKRKWIITLVLLLLCCGAGAKVTLPSVLGDGMVLQRNTRVKLWGTTDRNATVTVQTSWNGEKYRCKPHADGIWQVAVATPEAGGPYSIRISDGDFLELKDVLVGEVWICSGQSNMEMPVAGWEHQRVEGALETISDAASTPLLRMFTVARNNADSPQEDCSGAWKTSTPEHVAWFSAAAYHFGKTLSRYMPEVPVGLIATDWGGTPIEAWLSTRTLEAIPGINLERSKAKRWMEVTAGQLFNGMIYPLRHYAARGFIWYQGEANLDNSDDYVALTCAMVEEWRTLWGKADMPYYLVQIAPYSYDEPDSRKLPLLIEQQYRIPSVLPFSGVAPTTDVGHRDCIHPPYKKEVGERLAYLALSRDYGVSGLPATPLYKSMQIEEGTVRLHFDGVAGSGNCFRVFGPSERLVPGGFEIAGEDRVWHPAQARIEWGSSDIVVSSPDVPAPVAVRYAFRNWPEGANVVTDYGIPLPPFRTDNWPEK